MRDPDDTQLSRPANVELHDINRRLDNLESGVTELRSSVASVREALAARGSFPGWGWGLLLAAVIQITAVATGAGITVARVESLGEKANKALEMIEQHVASAGPFRAGVERWQKDTEACESKLERIDKMCAANTLRVEQIEKRNAVADTNWDKLKSKGLLVESTKP